MKPVVPAARPTIERTFQLTSAFMPHEHNPAATALPGPLSRIALHGRHEALSAALGALSCQVSLIGDGQVDWPTVFAAWPGEARPDVLVCVLDLPSADRRLVGVERLEIPTVGLIGAADVMADAMARAAARCDYVVCARHEQEAALRLAGCRNVYVLEAASDASGLLSWLLATPSRGWWLLAGNRHLAAGDVPAAINAFSQALTLCPTSAEALNNLGVCTMALDRPAEARELFLAALRQDPGLASAREHLSAIAGPAPAPDPLGDVSGYYMGDRPELRRLVPADTRRVLEVGCAAGGFGAALKQERPDMEVVGVEYNRKAALHAARRLDVVLQGSIDDMPDFPYPHGYFDCFVFGDVLEHLPDPEQTLINLLPYLKAGGHIVLSLPNVRHYEVVWDLLVNGKWTYLDAGILDRTHLRFFTYQEIVAMIARLGLTLETVDVNKWVSYPDCYHALTQVVKGLGGDAAAFEQEGAVGQYLVRMQKPPISENAPRQEVRAAVPQAAAPGEAPVASIVMLTLNQLDYTKLCVESVFERSTLPFELIIVDNGSTDGTRAYLRRLVEQDPRVRVIHNDRNMGFAHGCNQGIAVARGEVIVLLNNDTIVTDGWLEGLVTPMAMNAEIGAVGPRSNRVAGVQVVPFVPYGSDLEQLQVFARRYAEFHRGQGGFVDRAVGFCLAVRRSVLEHIGGLDTRFGIGNFEDDDLCLRVRTLGLRVWIASDVFIHHFGSQTFLGEKIDHNALMTENSQKFAEKWHLPHMPQDAFDAGRLARLPFDRTRDVFPILVPEADGAPIAGARAYHFLALPDWHRPERCLEAIKAFNTAFTADDDVAMLLWVDPTGDKTVEEVGRELGALLAANGLDGERAPELVLFDTAFNPMTLSSLYRTAQACLPLGEAAVVEAARACGLAVIEAPTADALRAAAPAPQAPAR